MQLGKEKKVTFEDDMKNTKTNMNNNLLTQTIEGAREWKTLIKQCNLLPESLNTQDIIE